MSGLRVLSVTSELFPLVKTGGLADVAGALPGALAAAGVEMRTLLPAYPAVKAALPEAVPVLDLPGLLGVPARLLAVDSEAGDLLLLDAPTLYDRPGNPYTGPDGRDWPDNARRFAALALAAARIGEGALPGWRPQVLHGHDWQAGLLPAYLTLRSGGPDPLRPATVHTIHNLAYQGWFEAGHLGPLELPAEAFRIDGLEHNQGLGFLKAALFYADKLTTVSPTYAREIQTEAAGMGLHGLLRGRGPDLVGIVNGLDTGVWDPASDPHLPARFGPDDLPGLAGKAVCKTALRARMGLQPRERAPLLAVVSRLTHQKGLDLVLAALPAILERGGQLVLLGSGEPALEQGFREAAARHPGEVACMMGYDESLAHLIQAGSDVILVPSRFEPCGLTQLIGLRYGTLPLVARTGGLADTVIDASPAALGDGVATGFQFAPATLDGLMDALTRLFELWADPDAWASTRARALTREVGWSASAKGYAAVYQAAWTKAHQPDPLTEREAG